MPIRSSYEGETFVAFLDVSGFKKIMEAGVEKAAATLNKFYATIFNETSSFNRQSGREGLKVRSIIVSDSAVIFLYNTGLSQDKLRDLGAILGFLRKVNKHLIGTPEPAIMTSCSIAHGRFKYEKTFELGEMSKSYFIGWPYVKAFSDSEYGEPKIRPGQCRILRENLELPNLPTHLPFSLLEMENKHWYFYWMLSRNDEIAWFKHNYNNTWEGIYDKLIELIRQPHVR